MTYGITITAAGFRLLNKLLSGETLEITRVMVGSGRIDDTDDPGARSDLIAPVAQATSTVPVTVGTTSSFIIEYRNDLNGGLDHDFYLCEIGIFARDPDDGEILLYYATLGDYPQYVKAYDNAAVEIRRFPVTITLTDNAEVVLAYPALAFMTAEDVESYVLTVAQPIILDNAAGLIAEHNVSSASHPDLRALIASLAGRVGRLEVMLLHNITGNPYFYSFDTLDGLIVEGVWNYELERIEF